MKKDILFLCQFFYPEHNSSATLPFDTASYLVRRGFSVDALVGYPKEYSNSSSVPMRERKNGVQIQRIRYLQLSRGKKLSRLVNYLSFTVRALLRLFQLRKYKIVVVYSNPPILPIVPVLANLLFRTKFVFVAYDIYPEVAFASNSLRPGSVIDRGMQWVNHMLCKRVSTVVSLTDEMMEFLLANRPELSPERVVTIANWAHEKKTEPTEAAYTRFGYKPGQFIVSYFGNMGICQEMGTLVQAVERMKDNDQVRFLFIGHGSKQTAISEFFTKQGLKNVQMHDFLTGEAFEQAVAISSCCVVSLEAGLKGMCAPSKYYSYLQGGKPVIAVVEAGSYLEQELTAEKIGAAVRIGDVDGLVKVLSQLEQTPDEAAAMGRRSAELYERKYALEIGTSRYCTMLEQLLNKEAGGTV